MTKTTTTYALPDEPEGPVWDRNGGRWDISPVHGLWCGPGRSDAVTAIQEALR